MARYSFTYKYKGSKYYIKRITRNYYCVQGGKRKDKKCLFICKLDRTKQIVIDHKEALEVRKSIESNKEYSYRLNWVTTREIMH